MTFGKVILICGAAIVFNLLGSAVTRTFNLPLFLDTGGTIFIAMLSGYVPGIVVGFATNLLNSFFVEGDMYYCSINIFVAIYTTHLARRGYYETFAKTLLTIPALIFVTTICRCLIEKFLTCTGVVEAFNQIELHFAEIFIQELIDKGLLVLMMFLVVKFVPSTVKKVFRGLGQRQAPITDDMKHAINRWKCPRSSLRTKMLLIMSLSALFIAVSIAMISYNIFKQAAYAAQIKLSDGLAKIIANEIIADKVDDYIRLGRAEETYKFVEQDLRFIKDSHSDINYLYVYRVAEDGCQVVFDLNDDSFVSGEVVELDNTARPYLEDMLAGKEIAPIISKDDGGYLLTIYKPVYDSVGKCQCYVVLKVSMDLISHYGRTFIAKVLALFSGCFVFIFVIGLRFVENNVTLPVNTMSYCAGNFAYDSDKGCKNNLEQIRRLDIHTGDEIENLYNALLKTTGDVLDYFERLRRAKKQVAEMDELAHKDSLTGIKNKAAYDEVTARFDKKISAGTETKFSIAMVDVNFLKRVNDTYGHERGNIYLMNASKLICSIFGEEHVYRIGGDEFVVVIEGEKASLMKYFVSQFNAEMARKNSNDKLEAWEKVSAAVGVADYQTGVDKTADEVFKRADKQMYDNKLAMKAARTD